MTSWIHLGDSFLFSLLCLFFPFSPFSHFLSFLSFSLFLSPFLSFCLLLSPFVLFTLFSHSFSLSSLWFLLLDFVGAERTSGVSPVIFKMWNYFAFHQRLAKSKPFHSKNPRGSSRTCFKKKNKCKWGKLFCHCFLLILQDHCPYIKNTKILWKYSAKETTKSRAETGSPTQQFTAQHMWQCGMVKPG